MNKQEYLQRLETCLRHKLSREEIDDIMRDYAEYFEEGRRQSKQDSEISAKLGDPELVAQQLIEESQEQNTFCITPKIKGTEYPAGGGWKRLGVAEIPLSGMETQGGRRGNSAGISEGAGSRTGKGAGEGTTNRQ